MNISYKLRDDYGYTLRRLELLRDIASGCQSKLSELNEEQLALVLAKLKIELTRQVAKKKRAKK